MAIVAVAAGVVLPATAASAHSQLVAAYPEPGAHLPTAPDRVTLRFNEPVEINLGAIRVFDHEGKQLATTPAHHPDGNGTEVQVELPRGLGDGGYVVAWRVVSADSHPIHAAYSFTVGTSGQAVRPGVVASVVANDRSDTTVSVLLAATRLLVFAGVAVAVGGLVFVNLCWTAGRDRRGTGIVLMTAAVVATIASLAMIALQAPYATGRTIGAAFEPSGWRAVAATRSGTWWLVRTALLAGVGALVATRRWATGLAWRIAAVIVTAVLFVAMAFSGHGGNGRAPALGVIDTVAHLAAMSAWIGGLVLLAIALLRGEPDDREPAARRFSSLALSSVALVAVSGSVEAWRQVGQVHALLHSDYGRLLLIKVALVGVVLAVAVLSRRSVHRRGSFDSVKLRRLVLGEQVIAAGVLVVTAILVNTAPAISQANGPFSATLISGNRTASVTIAPARVGANLLHVYLFDSSGGLQPASQIRVELSLPDRDIGPLKPALRIAGPNHAIGDNVDLPFAGTWTLDIYALYGFDEVKFTTTVQVR